jgi:hypothetical protein
VDLMRSPIGRSKILVDVPGIISVPIRTTPA